MLVYQHTANPKNAERNPMKSEGLFAAARTAMRGQDNSIFETPEGRILAYMNPAGNLIIERCYDDRQLLSVDPDDEFDGSSGRCGFDDAKHGFHKADTTEPWNPEQDEIDNLLDQLNSVTPTEFFPPDDDNPIPFIQGEDGCPNCHAIGRQGPNHVGGTTYCYQCGWTY